MNNSPTLQEVMQTSMPVEVPSSGTHTGREYTGVNLGSGPNVITGWLNLDIDERAGVTHCDLRGPVPLPTESVQYAYSEHFIEHVLKTEAFSLLVEVRRVLRPGGTLRIATPDLRYAAKSYLAGEYTEWSDVGFNPQSSCDFLNESMRSWGHMYLYDLSELAVLLRRAGFSAMRKCAWRESQHEALSDLETRPYHGDLILEASK